MGEIFQDRVYRQRMTDLLERILCDQSRYNETELLDLFMMEVASDQGSKFLTAQHPDYVDMPFPKKAKRILMIRLAFIGDVVITTPSINWLRATYPDAEIDYLTQAPSHKMLQGLRPDIHKVFELPYRNKYVKTILESNRFDNGIEEFRELLGELRARRYDLVINLHPSVRSAALSSLLRRPYVMGLSLREYGRLRIAGNPAMHRLTRVQLYREHEKPPVQVADLINQPCGTPTASFPMSLTVPSGIAEEHKQWMEGRGISRDEKVVGLNPGANWHSKRWSVDHFVDLGRRIQTELSYRTLVFTAPGEEHLAEAIARGIGEQAILLRMLNLVDLTGAIKGCDVFITGDTGPIHMAAALNVPTVGIMGKQITPTYTEKGVLLTAPHECPQDCPGPSACELIKGRCIDHILPDDVFAALLYLLQNTPISDQHHKGLRQRQVTVSEPVMKVGESFAYRIVAPTQ